VNQVKGNMPVHVWLSEPELAFHPERAEDRHIHPLLGLSQFGPFSRSLINQVIDPIRVAVITPSGEFRTINHLISELEQKHEPRERRPYLPTFSSFSRVFGLRVVPAHRSVHIELERKLDAAIAASPRPHIVLAEAISQALSLLEPHRSEFDVLMLLLPSRWQIAFKGGVGEDFDLHDYVKAITAIRGIPSQILLEDRAITYPCRCSVMWHLGIALYTKAGGVPWKLADADPELAYVGLAYALKPPSSSGGRFVTCCSQVFDSDGAGLEFIAYETQADGLRVEQDNPFLSRQDMMRLISRSLSLYQRRHAGRRPSRLIIHKSTELKPEEVDGCFDAWPRSDGLELVQIQQDVSWRGIKIDRPWPGQRKGGPARFPIDRGTFLMLSGLEVLLWTQGNARQIGPTGNFFKEGREIPHPILLRRFAGHGGWRESNRHVLGLTKMDWNNDSLYDRIPVTLLYAQRLARVVRRMPQIAPKEYQFRFFM
jgi:hypothetical protein